MHAFPRHLAALLCAGATFVFAAGARAETATFFDAAQGASFSTGTISETLTSAGYRFTYSRDNFFSGGVGLTTPVGRLVMTTWPTGLHAQAITVAPPGGSVGGATLTIRRVDGGLFDFSAMSFKLLANTAGAGAEMEIAPILAGEEGPHVFLDATGIAGNTFSYSQTRADWRGFTMAPLTQYDTYKLGLYVDFALTGATLEGAAVTPVPEPDQAALLLLGLATLLPFAQRLRRRTA